MVSNEPSAKGSRCAEIGLDEPAFELALTRDLQEDTMLVEPGGREALTQARSSTNPPPPHPASSTLRPTTYFFSSSTRSGSRSPLMEFPAEDRGVLERVTGRRCRA